MDANGTRFHLLLGYDDWSGCTAQGQPLRQDWETLPAGDTSGLAWDVARNELTLQPRLFRFRAPLGDNPPAPGDRRGAGRDRYGNWYWIDASRRAIRVGSSGTGTTADFWTASDSVATEPRAGDFQPLDPPAAMPAQEFGGLAVTKDHYLVVGTLQPAGLLIFDLHAGGPPRQLLWPTTVPFVPFDMAPMPGGGVWVLDQINARFWALDRMFDVVKPLRLSSVPVVAPIDDFQPTEPGAPRRTLECAPVRVISLDAATPTVASMPIAIEALPDCSVLILGYDPSLTFALVYRHRFDGQAAQVASTESSAALIDEPYRAGFQLIGHDLAFVGEHTDESGQLVLDRVYIATSEGNQVYAFHISQRKGQLLLQVIDDYLPMRLFGGKGLVGAAGQVYYDFADRWIPLVAQRRPRYVAEATLQTPLREVRPALDGREPGCVWHRLLIDGCLPAETEVQVWSRAADDPRALALAEWQPEPRPYRRRDGSELPFVARGAGQETWELLFQRACGRYLQIRLALRGNGRSTPRLRALRAYYPRFSYLERYLPALYREDRQSASFLDRFLANLEGVHTAIEDKIAAVQVLFDTSTAPPEMLEWLASWLGIVLDPAWDPARQRLFIGHAVDFFRYRGTMRGLEMALRLAFEECADETIFTEPGRRASPFRIVEQYRTRRAPALVFGDPTEASGLRLVLRTERWDPAQGAAELDRRYAEVLRAQGLPVEAGAAFPPAEPADPAVIAVWRQFARDTLRFVPSATADDQRLWQDFLARRYQQVETFNQVYQLSGARALVSFTDARLPDKLPREGAPLRDWYQFQGVVLAMHRTAHRFRVLLPLPKDNPFDPEAQQRHMDLARRVVELEKPAHTIFDVKFYWAFFRIGESRIGTDTLLDRGSRAPQLLPRMVLGQQHLAESYLAPGHPQDVADRQVLGRDRLAEGSAFDRRAP